MVNWMERNHVNKLEILFGDRSLITFGNNGHIYKQWHPPPHLKHDKSTVPCNSLSFKVVQKCRLGASIRS